MKWEYKYIRTTLHWLLLPEEPYSSLDSLEAKQRIDQRARAQQDFVQLQQLGAEGWEVISVEYNTNNFQNILLKRESRDHE